MIKNDQKQSKNRKWEKEKWETTGKIRINWQRSSVNWGGRKVFQKDKNKGWGWCSHSGDGDKRTVVSGTSMRYYFKNKLKQEGHVAWLE
jgi:hypothetical protein